MPDRHINPLLSRRGLLKGGAGMAAIGAAGLPTLTALNAVMSRPASAALPDYGTLVEVADEATGLNLLKLPDGFRYISYGWTTDPLRDGTPTPGSHDGMAVISETGEFDDRDDDDDHHSRRRGNSGRGKGGRDNRGRDHHGRGNRDGDRVILVRNHERSGPGESFAPRRLTYDSAGRGGTTSLEFDTRRGRWIKSWASLGGTSTNCAGGPTPWGSWLTCEETVDGPLEPPGNDQLPRQHGWVFEVPADRRADPEPIRDMGVFDHEACAVDPISGFVYETQDEGGDSGFYRYEPRVPGKLAAGGTLFMLKIVGFDGLDLTDSFTNHFDAAQTVDVEWVEIDDPHRVHTGPGLDDNGVFDQGFNKGGARFNALEGCWYESGVIVFTDKSSNNGNGSVYMYNPFAETLNLIIDFPDDPAVLAKPDNITAHRKRGLLVCEDSSAPVQRMQFLTFDGQVFPFAENNIELPGGSISRGFSGSFRNREWAGATFTKDGEWLFANIQDPGITFAITGPWKDFTSTAG